jgi:2-oxoisovalerate dehydrogenase E1 component beta subunit
VFRCTDGLQAKYGKTRVFDAPISEGGIVGSAIGMAAYGLRPVVEVQFADYFYPASDQIVSEAARLRYRSAGDFTAPITIRMPCGGGIYGGQTHSQSPESLFTHVCGIRTVMPSNPYDAKGLLIASIENDDPVIFLEPKRLYNGPFDGHHGKPVVPWAAQSDGRGAGRPLHRAARIGGAVPQGRRRHRADLRDDGLRVRGGGEGERRRRRDRRLRSLWPLDLPGDRRVGQEDAPLRRRPRSDPNQRLRRRAVALVQEHCFYHLEAPIERVTGLGHAVSARARVGVFSRAGSRRRRPQAGDGALSDMGVHVIRVPDLGEGIAEVELVVWHVAPATRSSRTRASPT